MTAFLKRDLHKLAKTATSRSRMSGGRNTRRESCRRNEDDADATVQGNGAGTYQEGSEVPQGTFAGEGVECLLAGDLDTGKAILRDYINATIGFEELSRLTRRPAKSLMSMLGPRGNPQARKLFYVTCHFRTTQGV